MPPPPPSSPCSWKVAFVQKLPLTSFSLFCAHRCYNKTHQQCVLRLNLFVCSNGNCISPVFTKSSSNTPLPTKISFCSSFVSGILVIVCSLWASLTNDWWTPFYDLNSVLGELSSMQSRIHEFRQLKAFLLAPQDLYLHLSLHVLHLTGINYSWEKIHFLLRRTIVFR